MKLHIVMLIFVSAMAANNSGQHILKKLNSANSVDDLKKLVGEANQQGLSIDWDDSLANQASSAACTLKSEPPSIMFQIMKDPARKVRTDTPLDGFNSAFSIGCAPKSECPDIKFVCLAGPKSSGSSGSSAGSSGSSAGSSGSSAGSSGSSSASSGSSSGSQNFTSTSALLAILSVIYL